MYDNHEWDGAYIFAGKTYLHDWISIFQCGHIFCVWYGNFILMGNILLTFFPCLISWTFILTSFHGLSEWLLNLRHIDCCFKYLKGFSHQLILVKFLSIWLMTMAMSGIVMQPCFLCLTCWLQLGAKYQYSDFSSLQCQNSFAQFLFKISHDWTAAVLSFC